MPVFRVEKNRNFTVMSNHHLQNRTLSLKAKGLMSLMLSLPEAWDYTLFGLTKINNDGIDAIRAAVNELERHGYLSRRRIRNGNGQFGESEYTILEHPAPQNPVSENPMQGLPAQGKPVLDNPTQLNTRSVNMKLENTNPSIPVGRGGEIERIDERNNYRKLLIDNLEYDIMVERHGKARMDEIVELLLEAVCAGRKTCRIGGDDYPAEVVKSRLLKLDASHVDYVIDSMEQNTTKIHNIKAYLLTALYNAPVTIEHYYAALVNHDLYGKVEN